jgi:hypothetical protein
MPEETANEVRSGVVLNDQASALEDKALETLADRDRGS